MTWGWAGNLFIVTAMFCIARKWRVGWVFSFIGNLMWCWYAFCLNLMDALTIDTISLILAGYGWWSWSSYDSKKAQTRKASRGDAKDCPNS